MNNYSIAWNTGIIQKNVNVFIRSVCEQCAMKSKVRLCRW